MSTLETAKVILVTGKPGIGKTTLISRLFEKLKHEPTVSVCGFKTEEIRDPQSPRSGRVGFDIVLLDPDVEIECRSPLARVCGSGGEFVRGPRVGQYVVDVASFEQLAIPCLQAVLDLQGASQGFGTKLPVQLCIVDEIGKMESYSQKFTKQINKLIQWISSPKSSTILLATVPPAKRPDGSRGIGLVDHLCAQPEAYIVEVTQSNRDSLVDSIWNALKNRKL